MTGKWRGAPVSVQEAIRREMANLTASERKLANSVLAEYPFSGIQTIQELASRTGVSAPSITRFVSKIGFAGYQDFQRHLIGELREGRRSPLDLKATEKVGESDFLAEYARRASARLSEMASGVLQEEFDRVLKLLTDPARNIFLLGGRISDTIANLFSLHLRQIRPRVRHLPLNPEHWPDHILAMRKQDVFILFDFRRYQPNLERLAALVAAKRHTNIVLITDKWMSPIARHSNHVITLPIENDTAWDTAVCTVTFVEALIIKISQADWPATKTRIEAWDELRLPPPATRDEKSHEP